MGLGKTLTMLSLVMTNNYDGRPLAKKSIGFVRPKVEMNRGTKGKKRIAVSIPQVRPTIGKGSTSGNQRKRSAVGFFDKFKSSDEEEPIKEEKFSFGKKTTKKKSKPDDFICDDTSEDDSFSDASSDEFDAMSKVGRQFLCQN